MAGLLKKVPLVRTRLRVPLLRLVVVAVAVPDAVVRLPQVERLRNSRVSVSLWLAASYREAGGLPNLAASIATLVFISLSFAVYLPSSHEN